MPELPDVDVYVVHLQRRIVGATLEHIRLASPFLLRSVQPPLTEAQWEEPSSACPAWASASSSPSKAGWRS